MLHLDSAYIAAKDAEHRVQVLVVLSRLAMVARLVGSRWPMPKAA
jgi:hypothetical protein